MEPVTSVQPEQVVDFLVDLPHPEFLELLQRVFAKKVAYEESWNEGRFFLGIGERVLAAWENDEEIDEAKWGPWRVRAVAYVDRTQYDEGYPEQWGDRLFTQHGSCPTCGMGLSSYMKRAICPICGTQAGLT